MAIATGTAALLAGLATAGGGVAGSAIAGRSASKAANLQNRATDEALNFEKEKERRRQIADERYQREMAAYNAAWQRQRGGLLQRYGVPMGERMSLATIRRAPRLDAGGY